MLIGLACLIFGISLYFGRRELNIFLKPANLKVLLICILLIAIAWNVRAFANRSSAESMVGLSFHFFGASLLVVMFGFWEALVILFGIAIVGIYLPTYNLQEAARHYLSVGVLPACISMTVITLIKRFLPQHLFVFILGRGYVAGLMSTLLSGIILALIQNFFTNTPIGGIDPVGWFLVLLVLSFTEGSLSGMLLAILTIYKPEWVKTYDVDTHLGPSNHLKHST